MKNIPKNGDRQTSQTPRWVFVAVLWFGSSLILLGIFQIEYVLSRERALEYREGDLVSEDFILDTDIEFVDKEATAKVAKLNRSLVPPVYVVREERTQAVLEKFSRFAAAVRLSNEEGEEKGILQKKFPGIGGLVEGRSSRNRKETEGLINQAQEVMESLLFRGIYRIEPKDGGDVSGVLEMVYSLATPDRRVTLNRDSVPRLGNLQEQIRGMGLVADSSPKNVSFIVALVTYFAEPNVYFDEALTQKDRNETFEKTEPVKISIKAGTPVLSEGQVVTAQQAKILQLLRSKNRINYQGLINPFLYMAVTFIFGVTLYRTFGVSFEKTKIFWLYAALSGIYLVVTAVLVSVSEVIPNAAISAVLPTSLLTLLLSQLLNDRRIAVITSLLMAAVVYFMTDGNTPDLLITLAAGMGGALSIRRKETRVGLFLAGPRISIVMLLSVIFASFISQGSLRQVLITSGVAVANGLITGIMSLAFLPLLEHMLNMATTFRLLELSDQNVPILKRMRLQSPGTYIHSQNVAHLAEAACDAIGANGLLARVGAYYHDIGKVDQPHYFVENQKDRNRHDEMKATLSIAVIKSHVKIGVEKGRQMRLPKEVLDIIEQHHGTSLIRYFYDLALKENKNAAPQDYSYGGPKPRSRETAVVMLADLAEAAARTLEKPNKARLEKYIWDLIMERFKSGELNESPLKLQHLETIKEAFVHVLTGHFHSRIEYPSDAEEKSLK